VPPSPSSPERELGREGGEDTVPLLSPLDAALVFFPALRAVHVRVVPECSPQRVVPDYVGFLRKGLGRTAARFADSGSNLGLPGCSTRGWNAARRERREEGRGRSGSRHRG
jgi:hypothetical protein